MFHDVVKTKYVILARIKGCVVVSNVKNRKTKALFWRSNAFWLMQFEAMHAKYLNQNWSRYQNSFPGVNPNGVTNSFTVASLKPSHFPNANLFDCSPLIYGGDKWYVNQNTMQPFLIFLSLIFSTLLWVIRSRITGGCYILKIRV